jgi:hypothetical protein
MQSIWTKPRRSQNARDPQVATVGHLIVAEPTRCPFDQEADAEK